MQRFAFSADFTHIADDQNRLCARGTRSQHVDRCTHRIRIGVVSVIDDLCANGCLLTLQTAGNTVNEIVSSVQQVGDIVGGITATSAEQSEEIREISASIDELDQMTQQNAALVEESAAAAQSLKDQSARLAHAVSMFHT